MQLQFHKEAIPILKPVKREVKNVEQTQEIRIDDGMPDIGSVLGAWGQVILRTKEWQHGSAGINGGVQVSVLYKSEDGEDLQAVEAWIPFQAKWELPSSDAEGSVCVHCLLRSVDARNTNSRKLLIRVNVGVCGQLWEPTQLWQYTPPELPEDVCLLRHSWQANVPQEAGEKSFSLEEDLTLPAAVPKIQKLLHYHMRPELIEQKIMSDKVVFRGAGLVHILYRGEDGQLHTWDFEVPFSQYGELSRSYEEGATAQLTIALTSLEAEITPEGNILLKAGLVGQYLICQQVQLHCVEDAYSPYRQVLPALDGVNYMTLDSASGRTVAVEQLIQSHGIPVDLSCYPDHGYLQRLDENSALQIPGQFQVLHTDADGQLCLASNRWELSENIPVQSDCSLLTVQLTGKPQCSIDGAGMVAKADVQLQWMGGTFHNQPVVTGLEVAEVAEQDPERPSLILRRAGQESLWELAKTYGSTVAAITEANGLESQPEAGQMLLIPVL